jgi:hypothetical protein
MMTILAVTTYHFAAILIWLGIPVRRWRLLGKLPKPLLLRMQQYDQEWQA